MFSDTELDDYRKEFRKIGLSFTDEEMREILGYLYGICRNYGHP